jgi:DNA-binding NarL/FixJ family response regulator
MTIALVDDHKILLKQTTSLLKTSGYNVAFTANDGDEIVELLSNAKQLPSVIFVDVNMPKMDGVMLTNIITTSYPTIAVIALSMYTDDVVVKDMFASGARGYISKSNFQKNFKEAIETVLNGDFYFDITIEEALKPLLQRAYELRQGRNAAFYGLSKNDIVFLQLFSSNMAKQTIAKVLNVSPKSIHNFTDRLRENIGVGDRQGLTLYALQNGIAHVAKLPK